MLQLIGMLDSPYVRRTAITLHLLGIPFASKSISVFRGIEEFEKPVIAAINGVALGT